MAQFSCETEGSECVHLHCLCYHDDFKVCCAVVLFHDMYNVTVKGISIAQMLNTAGIILKNVSGSLVQLNASCSLTTFKSFGIESTSVDVHSSSAHNCALGLVLHNTTNTHITEVAATNNYLEGIVLITTTDTYINITVLQTIQGMVYTYQLRIPLL